MAPSALTLAVLLSVDTLKTCVVVDALTRGRHDSDRTLLGQGAGNVVNALLGGMPGAGTMGATLVNIESGGRSRGSTAIAAGFALLVAVALSRALAWVPVAALAGILLVVATRDAILCREPRIAGQTFEWTDNPPSLASWIERGHVKVVTPGVTCSWVRHVVPASATAVVVGRWPGHDGGEVVSWTASSTELADAVAADYVRPLDPACKALVVCGCGAKFITIRAWSRHRTIVRAGRGCAAA